MVHAGDFLVVVVLNDRQVESALEFSLDIPEDYRLKTIGRLMAWYGAGKGMAMLSSDSDLTQRNSIRQLVANVPSIYAELNQISPVDMEGVELSFVYEPLAGANDIELPSADVLSEFGVTTNAGNLS